MGIEQSGYTPYIIDKLILVLPKNSFDDPRLNENEYVNDIQNSVSLQDIFNYIFYHLFFFNLLRLLFVDIYMLHQFNLALVL